MAGGGGAFNKGVRQVGSGLAEPCRALDAPALRDWAHTAVGDLITHIDEINRLNVFPVADSDTGVNMLFTMRSALAEANAVASSKAGPGDVVRVAAALSAGALNGGVDLVVASMGGQEVSGTIVSVLRAAADAVEQSAGEGLARAITAAG